MNNGCVVREMVRLPCRPRWIEFPPKTKPSREHRRAFAAGVLSAVMMTAALAAARKAKVTPLDFPMFLGSALTRKRNAQTRALGLAWNLVNGGALAVGYALVFRSLGRSGWKTGAVLSAPHMVLAGASMALAPKMHPAVGRFRAIKPPGFMARSYGLGSVFAFIASHMLFGAAVGGMFRRFKRARW